MDEELRARWKYAFEQARADRERYFNWIRNEINIAIQLIDRYDKIYVLGGLGTRLLRASPNLYNQLMSDFGKQGQEYAEQDMLLEDDQVETILEYAMNLATASPNSNVGTIPTSDDIEEIRQQLIKINQNIGFYETSAELPSRGNESDHWIKMMVMREALYVRGSGFQSHAVTVYQEMFAPHDGFLNQYYRFNSSDILGAVEQLQLLVTSKIGNAFGGSLAHRRLMKWHEDRGREAINEEMIQTGKHFIRQFTEANPDLYDQSNPDEISLISLENILSYNRLFWVIPKTEVEKVTFDTLSHQFGDNQPFVEGKFGGFPLGDSIVQNKPLIKADDRYYCFSLLLPLRSIFTITTELLKAADAVYHDHTFRGNSSPISRDNYLEIKVKQLFEKLLPTVEFYHSLKYNVIEDGVAKTPELDILGIGEDALYVIEVKSGELNKKHRRGAVLGLKDRLKETVNEGSYQCHRAAKYIDDSATTKFVYTSNGKREELVIDKNKDRPITKISVTYEQLSTVSVNLKYLIESGILSPDYKRTWIVSLYDLMIFADLIENENDFREYIQHRLELYERNDIEFHDEIDILGFFLEGGFPLKVAKETEKLAVRSYSADIENYYTRKELGMHSEKPKRRV